MPKYGGAMLPRPIRGDDGKRRCSAIFWGKVVGAPGSKSLNTRRGPVNEDMFLLATSRKQFQRCRVRSDALFYFLIHAWEKGDTVLVFGEYEEFEYMARERKKGGHYDPDGVKIEKTSRDFTVQFAIPAQLIVDPVGYIEHFTREADPIMSAEVSDVIDQDAEADAANDPENAWLDF